MPINSELDTPLGRKALAGELTEDRTIISPRKLRSAVGLMAATTAFVSSVDTVNAGGSRIDLVTNTIYYIPPQELFENKTITTYEVESELWNGGRGGVETDSKMQARYDADVSVLNGLYKQLQKKGVFSNTGLRMDQVPSLDPSIPPFPVLRVFEGEHKGDVVSFEGMKMGADMSYPSTLRNFGYTELGDNQFLLVARAKKNGKDFQTLARRTFDNNGQVSKVEVFDPANKQAWSEVAKPVVGEARTEGADLMAAKDNAGKFLRGEVGLKEGKGIKCNAGTEPCRLNNFTEHPGAQHKFENGAASPQPLVLGAFSTEGVSYVVLGAENKTNQRFVYLATVGIDGEGIGKMNGTRFRIADNPELLNNPYNTSSANFFETSGRGIVSLLSGVNLPAQADINFSKYNVSPYVEGETLGRLNPAELRVALSFNSSAVVDPIFAAYESTDLGSVQNGEPVVWKHGMDPKSINTLAAPLFRNQSELEKIGKTPVLAPYLGMFLVDGL